MSLKKPPFSANVVNQMGIASNLWRGWIQDLWGYIGNGPFPLKSYTVATVPDATEYTGHMIYVTDETGGATPAFSDGTSWRRTADRNVIS